MDPSASPLAIASTTTATPLHLLTANRPSFSFIGSLRHHMTGGINIIVFPISLDTAIQQNPPTQQSTSLASSSRIYPINVLDAEKVEKAVFLGHHCTTPNALLLSALSLSVIKRPRQILTGCGQQDDQREEDGAEKIIEDNFEKFMNIVYPENAKEWISDVVPLGMHKAYLTSKERPFASPPSWMPAEELQCQSNELRKGRLAAPLCWYKVVNLGTGPEDNKSASFPSLNTLLLVIACFGYDMCPTAKRLNDHTCIHYVVKRQEYGSRRKSSLPCFSTPLNDVQCERLTQFLISRCISTIHRYWFPPYGHCTQIFEVAYFKPKGYSTIVPDMLGYGNTAKPTDAAEYKPSLIVKDIPDQYLGRRESRERSLPWTSLYNPERVIAFGVLAVGYQAPSVDFNWDAINKMTKEKGGIRGTR
ncbi:epoxide hydrolase, partial [Moniliophthora roreri]